jgi:hypothetical protein
MSSAKEIVYNWRNLISGGRLSDDDIPSYSQLKYILNYKRLQYLRQDYTKNYFDTDIMYQDLGCLELEAVDSAECCHFETGCTIYRTKELLPTPLRFSDRLGFKVNAINKTKRFELILPERAPFISYTKYPSLTEKVYWLNGRLYMRGLYAINARVIAENPEDVKRFRCGDEACYTDEGQYPLPGDMIDLITKDVLGTELKALISLGQDLENNAKDDMYERTSQ